MIVRKINQKDLMHLGTDLRASATNIYKIDSKS